MNGISSTPILVLLPFHLSSFGILVKIILMMAQRPIQSHHELEVYKLAFDQAMQIFVLSQKFPSEERYFLTDQIRRSSRSVCANLGEAWRKRRYEAAFIAKLSDSEAEVAETQVWIEFAVHCKYVDVEIARELYQGYEKILGMLVSMINNPSNWLILKGNKPQQGK